MLHSEPEPPGGGDGTPAGLPEGGSPSPGLYLARYAASAALAIFSACWLVGWEATTGSPAVPLQQLSHLGAPPKPYLAVESTILLNLSSLPEELSSYPSTVFANMGRSPDTPVITKVLDLPSPRYTSDFWDYMDSHGLKPAFAPLCDFRTADGELPAAWAIVRVAHAELVGGNGTEEAWRLTMASEMSRQLQQEHDEGGAALACGVGDEACGEDVTCEARDVYEDSAGWLHSTYPHMTGREMSITCHVGLSTAAGRRLSVAAASKADPPAVWLTIRRGGSEACAVPSLSPVNFVAAPAALSDPHARVGVCMAVLRGTPLFTADLLRHQKRLGVDAVVMYTSEEYWRRNHRQLEVIARALELEVRVNVWPAFFTIQEVFWHSQLGAYWDCWMRHKDEFAVLGHFDSDDFLFGPSLEPINVKAYIQGFAAARPECATFEAPMVRYKLNSLGDDVKRQAADLGLDSLRRPMVVDEVLSSPGLVPTNKQDVPKSFYLSGGVRHVGVHYMNPKQDYQTCEAGLRLVHARFEGT